MFGVGDTLETAELLYGKAVGPGVTYIPILEENEDCELPFGALQILLRAVFLCALPFFDDLPSLGDPRP